jgi:hypothetical protein
VEARDGVRDLLRAEGLEEKDGRIDMPDVILGIEAALGQLGDRQARQEGILAPEHPVHAVRSLQGGQRPSMADSVLVTGARDGATVTGGCECWRTGPAEPAPARR